MRRVQHHAGPGLGGQHFTPLSVQTTNPVDCSCPCPRLEPPPKVREDLKRARRAVNSGKRLRNPRGPGETDQPYFFRTRAACLERQNRRRSKRTAVRLRMMFSKVFDRIVIKNPVSVMTRAAMEHALALDAQNHEADDLERAGARCCGLKVRVISAAEPRTREHIYHAPTQRKLRSAPARC